MMFLDNTVPLLQIADIVYFRIPLKKNNKLLAIGLKKGYIHHNQSSPACKLWAGRLLSEGPNHMSE